jgi:tetratricopeptide (TPR) repeat protein
MAVATALENGLEPPPEEEAEAAPEEDGAFDLARELDEELSVVMQSLPAEPQEQVSVEAVLSEFKKGVDKLIAPDDANTHHDLGIAYKEMGLLDDAVGEFERASRNAQREADALYMVGICRLEQGNQALAAQAFRQALQASIIKDNQRTAVNYELGSTLEAMGELADALEAFHAAQAVDSHFKDLAARIASLAPRAPKKAPGSNGNGAHAAGGKAGGDAGKKGKNIGYI